MSLQLIRDLASDIFQLAWKYIHRAANPLIGLTDQIWSTVSSYSALGLKISLYSLVLLTVLFVCGAVSSTIYALFYYLMIPTYEFAAPVHFKFGNDFDASMAAHTASAAPTAWVSLAKSGKQWQQSSAEMIANVQWQTQYLRQLAASATAMPRNVQQNPGITNANSGMQSIAQQHHSQHEALSWTGGDGNTVSNTIGARTLEMADAVAASALLSSAEHVNSFAQFPVFPAGLPKEEESDDLRSARGKTIERMAAAPPMAQSADNGATHSGAISATAPSVQQSSTAGLSTPLWQTSVYPSSVTYESLLSEDFHYDFLVEFSLPAASPFNEDLNMVTLQLDVFSAESPGLIDTTLAPSSIFAGAQKLENVLSSRFRAQSPFLSAPSLLASAHQSFIPTSTQRFKFFSLFSPSFYVRLIYDMIFFPWYLLGWMDDSYSVKLNLIDDFTEKEERKLFINVHSQDILRDSNAAAAQGHWQTDVERHWMHVKSGPAAFARLTLHASAAGASPASPAFANGAARFQFLSASLKILTKLSGLRWWMYHWRIPTALLFISGMTATLFLAALITYAINYQQGAQLRQDSATSTEANAPDASQTDSDAETDTETRTQTHSRPYPRIASSSNGVYSRKLINTNTTGSSENRRPRRISDELAAAFSASPPAAIRTSALPRTHTPGFSLPPVVLADAVAAPTAMKVSAAILSAPASASSAAAAPRARGWSREDTAASAANSSWAVSSGSALGLGVGLVPRSSSNSIGSSASSNGTPIRSRSPASGDSASPSPVTSPALSAAARSSSPAPLPPRAHIHSHTHTHTHSQTNSDAATEHLNDNGNGSGPGSTVTPEQAQAEARVVLKQLEAAMYGVPNTNTSSTNPSSATRNTRSGSRGGADWSAPSDHEPGSAGGAARQSPAEAMLAAARSGLRSRGAASGISASAKEKAVKQ